MYISTFYPSIKSRRNPVFDSLSAQNNSTPSWFLRSGLSLARSEPAGWREKETENSLKNIHIYTHPGLELENFYGKRSRKIVRHEEPVLESAPEPRDTQRGRSIGYKNNILIVSGGGHLAVNSRNTILMSFSVHTFLSLSLYTIDSYIITDLFIYLFFNTYIYLSCPLTYYIPILFRISRIF